MVKINNNLSDPVRLATGFRQGSGWGPQAYGKYVGPLGELLRLLDILYHLFADDTQLYTTLHPNNIQPQLSAFSFIEDAIGKDSRWMTRNKLKFKESKTEFMILGTRNQIKKVGHVPSELAAWTSKPSHQCKILVHILT